MWKVRLLHTLWCAMTCPLDQHGTLFQVYSQIFVECVCRNPLYQLEPDAVIDCPLFNKKLEDFLMGQPFAKSGGM